MLHAFAVFACAGVDFDFVALVHKQGNGHFKAGGDFGGFEHFTGGVAFDARLGPGDFAHYGGGQLDSDGFAVVELYFAGHAVFQVVQCVAHVFGFDFVLVEFAIHEDVHGVGEVGVGAFLVIENDLFHFVVSLEDDFGAHVAQQGFEFHAHGGRATAATGVFGFENDHGVFAVHDDVAGADFLGDFHGESFR